MFVLFFVVYRLLDVFRVFYDFIVEVFEKVWLKIMNIVLLGDFNCDFFCFIDVDGVIQLVLGMKVVCLQLVFDLFNMYNVILEVIRVMLLLCILIDFIVMIRKDLIIFFGVFFLGIFDYSLIYVIMNLKKKRLLLKCIMVRDYKMFDLDVF